MYGLIDIQRNLNDSANKGLEHTANLERNREMAGDQLRAQKKQNQMSAAGQGAAMGFMMTGGNPAGALIGGAGGFLVGSLFS